SLWTHHSQNSLLLRGHGLLAWEQSFQEAEGCDRPRARRFLSFFSSLRACWPSWSSQYELGLTPFTTKNHEGGFGTKGVCAKIYITSLTQSIQSCDFHFR